MEEQQMQQPQPISKSSDLQKDELSTMATSTIEVPEEKAVDKHVLKRLSTAMSLASDSEDEPGLVLAEKLSSRNSAPSFEDLKLNTVSDFGFRCHVFYCSIFTQFPIHLSNSTYSPGYPHSCRHRVVQHGTVVRGLSSHGHYGE